VIKTGQRHSRSLKDGREVFIDGGHVSDVTQHRAFRNAVQSVCHLYDFQASPENQELMTFEGPAGERFGRQWQLPTSYAELCERRAALEKWSELHAGFMGRTPDHVASCLAGMFMGLDAFSATDPRGAASLSEYFQFARANDLYLTYVIINPQADRSKAASQQSGEYLTAGIVDRDAEGITICGAKMLATGGVIANEIFVTCIQPLQKGDERFAVSFAVPINTPGLKIISRKSYEAAAPNIFDNPLSNRFDENDAVVYFDNVKVPWSRVFIAGDIEMCQKQFHATPAHVYQNYQAMIRLSVKLKFLVAVARRIAETNGILAFPPVRETLGQLSAEVAMVDSFIAAMEVKGVQYGQYFVPHRHTLYAAQTLTQQLYPKVLNSVRELAGGGMIMLPSSVSDFDNPQLADIIGKTQQSPACNAEEKVKFFKLAWDAVGSEFASRHQQYEMFYAGATFVVKGHAFRTYDWNRTGQLLDGVLSSYDLNGPIAQGAKGSLENSAAR
jgi:4-hydroxyphenylacetate 3-monooxygenase